MHYTALLALVFIGATQISAHKNPTLCYNYFLKKDGCVNYAADPKIKCNSTKKATNVQRVTHPLHHKTPEASSGMATQSSSLGGIVIDASVSLQRRYDDESKAFIVSPGKGVCGLYHDTTPGVCLWVGSEQVRGDNPSTAGWLNGAYTETCGKKVYIQRTGDPDSVIYANVVDACGFDTHVVEEGCFRIAFTNQTFYDLKPTKAEERQGSIMNVTWDFLSL